MVAMKHRGPKSSGEIAAAINVNGDPTRLEPPASLTDAERDLFSELVAANAPKHFCASDMPLLVSYIQSTLLSRQAQLRRGDRQGRALALGESRQGTGDIGDGAAVGAAITLRDQKTAERQRPYGFVPASACLRRSRTAVRSAEFLPSHA
jgi:hypothetical protein